MNTIANYISEPIIIITSIVFSLLTPVLIGGLLTESVANAYYVDQNYRVSLNSSYYSTMMDEMIKRDAMNYLRNNLWVEDSVTYEELEDYILLCEQAAEGKTYVSPELLLGVISLETHFNNDCKDTGAIGLCQMIFSYHKDRMSKIIGEEASKDDFKEPWKNIFCAADYLEEILKETHSYKSIREKDKTAFGLMWYNMGASTASTVYISQGRITPYAQLITKITTDLEEIFAKGEIWRAKT